MHSETTQGGLTFTTAAAARVLQLLTDEANSTLKLRLYITGGGCSGFQYGFTFEENVQAGDTLITTAGADLVVDPMSLQYLKGAVVDYQEGLEGSRFTVSNPNAKTTCGCGSSFAVDLP